MNIGGTLVDNYRPATTTNTTTAYQRRGESVPRGIDDRNGFKGLEN